MGHDSYLADVFVPFLCRYAHFDRLLHLPRGHDDAVQRPRRDGCHCARATAMPACKARYTKDVLVSCSKGVVFAAVLDGRIAGGRPPLFRNPHSSKTRVDS